MAKRRSETNFNWNGAEIDARIGRAAARATIALGEGISTHAKRFVHVVSGDLRRSIHTAQAHTGGNVPTTQLNVLTDDGALLDVGSWLDYACVEEVGRMHPFMQPAVDAVRPQAHMTVREAFKQEGF